MIERRRGASRVEINAVEPAVADRQVQRGQIDAAVVNEQAVLATAQAQMSDGHQISVVEVDQRGRLAEQGMPQCRYMDRVGWAREREAFIVAAARGDREHDRVEQRIIARINLQRLAPSE